jgi:hypothetical protein
MSISTGFAIDARSRTPRVIRSLPGAISGLDFRLSARLRVRNPGLTLLAGFGIAVAIGITTGVFGTVDSSIAPRLPLEDAKRIVALENWSVSANNEARQSTQDFLTWREQMESVVEISAFRNIPAWIETGPASTEDITLDRITGSVAAAQTVLLVPAVALLMRVAGLCAAFVPTRRGLSVQPVEALRAE